MHRAIMIGAVALAGIVLAGCSSQSASNSSDSTGAPAATGPAASAPAVPAEPSIDPSATFDAATVERIEARAKANPSDPSAQFDLGDLYFVNKDFAKAQAAYQALVGLVPEDPSAWTALGAAAYQAGDNATALQALEKAVALDPSSQEAHYDLAFVYLSDNPPNPTDATSALERAVELDPNSAIGQAAQQTLTSMIQASASPE